MELSREERAEEDWTMRGIGKVMGDGTGMGGEGRVTEQGREGERVKEVEV